MLKLVNISKCFAKDTPHETEALKNIRLSIKEGEFMTVIGSNGAGKSTLLNIIAGTILPDKGGKIIINGNDITDMSEHKRAKYIGRVYQDPYVGTAAKMSIEENLSLAILRGKQRGLKIAINKERREFFYSQLEQLGLGLEHRLTAPVGTLSGGQRQALALVMSTMSNPSLLLLDEHIATLDPKTARIVLELTEMIIQREKMTAMMVTHNMAFALRYGNRLIMMHKGKIIVDFNQEQKANLTVNNLVSAFEKASGEEFADDSILLQEN